MLYFLLLYSYNLHGLCRSFQGLFEIINDSNEDHPFLYSRSSFQHLRTSSNVILWGFSSAMLIMMPRVMTHARWRKELNPKGQDKRGLARDVSSIWIDCVTFMTKAASIITCLSPHSHRFWIYFQFQGLHSNQNSGLYYTRTPKMGALLSIPLLAVPSVGSVCCRPISSSPCCS